MRLCFLVVLLGVTASAAPSSFELRVEPLIGYERVQKLLPTAHTRDRLFFGARVIAGLPLISAEGEYQRGYDEEVFASPAMTVRDTDDRARVGARSSFRLASVVSLHARAGAQATLNRREVIVAAVSTVTTNPLTVAPYAGAGLRINLAGKFSLSADATAIFRSWPDLSQNEYQVAAGLAVRLP